MAYTTNKEIPRVRREAVRLVIRGWSARKVGRHLGYHHTAVMKWVKRAGHYGDHPLPTRSSRPHTSPNQIDESIKKRIIDLRIETKRCTEVIHLMLLQEGIKVCKNTVHRVLDRGGFLKKRSPWKRYHPPIVIPVVVILVHVHIALIVPAIEDRITVCMKCHLCHHPSRTT